MPSYPGGSSLKRLRSSLTPCLDLCYPVRHRECSIRADGVGCGEVVTVEFMLGVGSTRGSNGGMAAYIGRPQCFDPRTECLQVRHMALAQDLEGTRSSLISEVIFLE